jgi:hypothetical protein
MKGLFFIIFLLCIFQSSLLISQSETSDVKTKDSLAHDSNLETLKVFLMIEGFTKELVDKGIKLNQQANNNEIDVKILFSNFNQKYGDEFYNTVALALGSNIDDLIKIDININIWGNLSTLEQVSTIWHEVGHDVLNVKHIEGDRLNLMHPFCQPRNENELEIMLNKFIRDFQSNRVEFFETGFYVHDLSKKREPYIIKLE